MIRIIQYIFRVFYPSLTWRVNTNKKILYLTFDDGPIPEVTPWVLEQLNIYNATATFFCIGDNVKKYPDIYNNILTQGHKTGNHTFSHLNGWKVPEKTYLENVTIAKEYIDSDLFRPPYGKITRSLIQSLKKEFRIVMWDVLSYDFDRRYDGNDCFQKVVRLSISGSIIVFHDSLKAKDRLQIALPQVLKHFSKKGYSFKALT